MDTFSCPTSLAVYGLSSKAHNTPRIIVDTCAPGFRGRLFGINPATGETDVGGVRVYRSATDLPVIPDLAVPIRAMYRRRWKTAAGRASSGWQYRLAASTNRARRARSAAQLLAAAGRFGIRFVGPNGL